MKERMAAYQFYKPKREPAPEVYDLVLFQRDGIRLPANRAESKGALQRTQLALRSGAVVRNPVDLLQGVEKGSATAKAIVRYELMWQRYIYFSWTGRILAGAGSIVILMRMSGLLGTSNPLAFLGSTGPIFQDSFFWLGMGLTVAGTVTYMIGYGYQEGAKVYKRGAFSAYHRDLMIRLGIPAKNKPKQQQFKDLHRSSSKNNQGKAAGKPATQQPAVRKNPSAVPMKKR